MSTADTPTVRKLRPSDLARLSAVGLRTRKMRAGLSALGIAIGVAAIVAVLGLSSSAQAGLLNEISRLGTNLLVVQNGQTVFESVTHVQQTGTVTGNVYRSPLIPKINTNAISIEAASLGLLHTVSTTVRHGSYLNAATAHEPMVVLGAAAAQRLGIDSVYPGERIWLDTTGFYLAGILNPAILAPQIDSSVLVGFPAAERYLGFDGHPSTIYVRARTSQVDTVDNLLAATANPENPSAVEVSQPSAALVAQADAQGAFDGLFLGLGTVALLVGAVGVANIMIISVMERRSEIGLRRALGATKGHIRIQFLAEAILLAVIGGAIGVGAGALATTVYASTKHEATVIPAIAWGGGLGAALLIGALAGLWPALRAARLSPTQALWSM
jgi:putative ABC transport system permease protein